MGEKPLQGGCGSWAWLMYCGCGSNDNSPCTQFRLFCRHPVTKELVEKRLEVHKDITLRDTIAESHKVN